MAKAPPNSERASDGGPDNVVQEAAGEVLEAFEKAGELSARIARGTLVTILVYLGEIGVLLGQTLRSKWSGEPSM